MKVRGNDFSVLEKYGFNKIDKEEALSNDDHISARFEYEYNLGHSRRGQFYSYLVDKEGMFHVYASKPDGSGDSLLMDNLLIVLYEEGIISE